MEKEENLFKEDSFNENIDQPEIPEQKIINQAMSLFNGTKDNPSHLNFKTWYHPDICHYLLQMINNQAQCVRVIFQDAGDGKNINTFKSQLECLITLSGYLNKPALFISKEPGAENHFICGLVKDSQLLFINPLGITKQDACYQTLAELQQEKVLNKIWLSSSPLQRREYEEEGLVSCGPISLELAMHILSEFTLEQLNQFWSALTSNEPTQHEASGLSYFGMSIKGLLPDSLQGLLTCVDPSLYQKRMCAIRERHGNALEMLAKQRAHEAGISIPDYLNHCRDSASAQLVFEDLHSHRHDKGTYDIQRLNGYSLLEQELKKPEAKNKSILPMSLNERHDEDKIKEILEDLAETENYAYIIQFLYQKNKIIVENDSKELFEECLHGLVNQEEKSFLSTDAEIASQKFKKDIGEISFYKEAKKVVDAIKLNKAFLVDLEFEGTELKKYNIKLRSSGAQKRHITPIGIIERIFRNVLIRESEIEDLFKAMLHIVEIFKHCLDNESNNFIQIIFEYFKPKGSYTSSRLNHLIKIIAQCYHNLPLLNLDDACIEIPYKLHNRYLIPSIDIGTNKRIHNSEGSFVLALLNFLDDFECKLKNKEILELSSYQISQIAYAMFALFDYLPLPMNCIIKKHVKENPKKNRYKDEPLTRLYKVSANHLSFIFHAYSAIGKYRIKISDLFSKYVCFGIDLKSLCEIFRCKEDFDTIIRILDREEESVIIDEEYIKKNLMVSGFVEQYKMKKDEMLGKFKFEIKKIMKEIDVFYEDIENSYQETEDSSSSTRSRANSQEGSESSISIRSKNEFHLSFHDDDDVFEGTSNSYNKQEENSSKEETDNESSSSISTSKRDGSQNESSFHYVPSDVEEPDEKVKTERKIK